ncbi:AmmeMemoRadiSam system radical SAM enzyme [Clostridium sp. CX1]|uniref:AmmeMemoRadiSam system radical SAM enzyme n=1 Tax=Clostridium sp. CX1 TaxID=2978346 RepID=UPI0021C1B682|nr:AmmeMemoRadiSam system radical SAM enzyme [Clostridium sp. CX1]MCT8977102.1 AmmeMemoRadiSam system radical SAM enzyme [Clostridium sp. CX1]
MKEALFYTKDQYGKILCELCPQRCHIKEGGIGFCGARKVEEGTLYSLNYGNISSISLDPIEKKPLYHFKPGSFILSVGSFGCNFRCGFCQNHSISQVKPDTQYVEPDELITFALKQKDNIGIAFTYNEPSIWYEYIYDICKRSANENLDMVLVSNGYISEKPLDSLLPYIKAANIDLKAFNNKFYRSICAGDMKPVLNNIERIHSKCHLELTTLLVEGYNDSEEEIRDLCKWISNLNPNIPLHLSRYFPSYKFDAPATSIEKITFCRDIAKEYLSFVYIGNVPGMDRNTYCPKCSKLLVKRDNFASQVYLEDNNCKNCGFNLNIII